MNEHPNDHPNVALVMRVGEAIATRDLDRAADVLAEDFVWHYRNPTLPDIAGDYRGLAGLKTLFEKLARYSNRTFALRPLSITPAGDELVVAHVRIGLERDGTRIETDAVAVWRTYQDHFTEVWDVPAIHAVSRAPA
jgi:uncharacterized protein